MKLWVLDTDRLTLWLRGHDTITARIAATPPQQLATTIITVEELLLRGLDQNMTSKTKNNPNFPATSPMNRVPYEPAETPAEAEEGTRRG